MLSSKVKTIVQQYKSNFYQKSLQIKSILIKIELISHFTINISSNGMVGISMSLDELNMKVKIVTTENLNLTLKILYFSTMLKFI